MTLAITPSLLIKDLDLFHMGGPQECAQNHTDNGSLDHFVPDSLETDHEICL